MQLTLSFRKKVLYRARLFIVALTALICLLPVIFIISNSLMSHSEASARYTSLVTPQNAFGAISGDMHYIDMTFIPDMISTSAWRTILLESPEYLRLMWNSLILSIPILVGQLIIAPLAAYGMERAKSRHKEKLFFTYIIIMLLPMQALLVPHFIAANMLGINNSYLAIILPAIFAPFGVFLVRQQLKGFNKDIIEAGKIDGASELVIFLRIVVPAIKPTISVLAVLAFAEAWNIIDQAVVFIRDSVAMPMSVYISTNLAGNMGIIFALSVMFMIPAMIIFIYGQEDMSTGLGYSGQK